MDAPDTVTEALALLRDEGYDAPFRLHDGHLWIEDEQVCAVAEARVERLFRFEGDSDPGDEMVVFGLVDPASGRRGSLASAFGPAADPEVLDQIVGLAARHRDR
jgi:hypothetical protein